MKKNKLKSNPYFRVIRGESGGAAELFLYGYIGQDFWWDEDLNEESLTDLAVVKAIRELEKDYNRINIRINSPGGSVYHGDPIIAAIKSSSAEIHTYNDGMAASMAADIWLCGKTRHMSSHSKLMIHATSTIEVGTAKDMRAAADRLDKFDEASIASFAEATGKTREEIKSQFFDYEDHWLTADDAMEMGLIEEVESYDVQQSVEDPERMSYKELVRATSLQHRIDVMIESKISGLDISKFLDKSEPEKEEEEESVTPRRNLAEKILLIQAQ